MFIVLNICTSCIYSHVVILKISGFMPLCVCVCVSLASWNNFFGNRCFLFMIEKTRVHI